MILDISQIPIENGVVELLNSEQQHLAEEIFEQLFNFNKIGIDIIKDNVVHDEIFISVINHINDNFLPIFNLNHIMNNSKYIQMFGRFIYTFICVDLVNIIIPKILKLAELTDPQDFHLIEISAFKEYLYESVRLKSNHLTELNKFSSSPKIYTEHLKWTYYLDLIDSNIEDLFDLITKIINQNETIIYSKM